MNQVLKLSWQIANNNTRQNGQDHNDNSNTTGELSEKKLQIKFSDDDIKVYY